MKYIITENKLENVVIKYLDRFYGDMEKKVTGDRIFLLKNEEEIFDKPISAGHVWVDGEFWDEINNMFILNKKQTNSLLKKWLKKTYGITGINEFEVWGGNEELGIPM